MKAWIFFCLAGLLSWSAKATNDWFDDLSEEDREALEALVLYPEDVRQAILVAGTQPQILVRLERMQAESQADFEQALSGLSQEDQEAVWNLTRYPGLIAEINQSIAFGTNGLQSIGNRYEAGTAEDILDQGRRNPNVLVRVQASMDRAESAYEQLLQPYPQNVRDAYAVLLGMPELLETLTTHLNLTVLVSDLYQRDPQTVTRHLDQLAVEASQRQEQALADWQNQLESDPQMRSELESAAAEFAKEEGWSDDQYTLPPAEPVVEVRYVYQPYPYWVGYPRWYTYPRWYPYPWWYHWGFYYGPRSTIVVYGMPTYTFWGWYYGRPYHHYYYPHLTNGCVAYYNSHRRTGVALNGPTRVFIERSQAVTGQRWDQNTSDRVNKIRDYGKLEMDYANQQSGRDAGKTRMDMLKENPKRYPALGSPAAQTMDPDRTMSRPKPGYQKPQPARPETPVRPSVRPEVKPEVKPEARPEARPEVRPEIKPDAKPDAPSDRPSRQETPRPSRPVVPGSPDRVIERPSAPAPVRPTRPEDYHRSNWNKPQASPSRPAPAPSRATPQSGPKANTKAAPRSSGSQPTRATQSRPQYHTSSPPQRATPSRSNPRKAGL